MDSHSSLLTKYLPRAGKDKNGKDIMFMSSLMDPHENSILIKKQTGATKHAGFQADAAKTDAAAKVDASKAEITKVDAKVEVREGNEDLIALQSSKRVYVSNPPSAVTSRWRNLGGQTLVAGDDCFASSSTEPDVLRVLHKVQPSFLPVSQVFWENSVRWNMDDNIDEETVPDAVALGDMAMTLEDGQPNGESHAAAPPPPLSSEVDNGGLEWEEDVPPTAAMSSSLARHSSSTSSLAMEKLSSLTLKTTSWDLKSNAVKSVRNWTPCPLGRNTRLASVALPENVLWDVDNVEEIPPSWAIGKRRKGIRRLQYHPLDDSFALDEIRRQKKIDDGRVKPVVAIVPAAAVVEVGTAAAAAAPSLENLGAINGDAQPREKGAGKHYSAGRSAPKKENGENGEILFDDVPVPKKKAENNYYVAGRNASKKELNIRRYNQYGTLLRHMGILEIAGETSFLPPQLIVAPIPQRAAEPEKPKYDPGWRALVPKINHSEFARELEFSRPQLLDTDLVKTYGRPSVTPFKDRLHVKIVTDPSELSGNNRADSSSTELVLLKSLSNSDRVWTKNDLSLRDGTICLLEYAERHPILLNGAGMNSQVVNFYRKCDGGKVPNKPDFGAFVGLNQDEVSPIMSQIESGQTYRVLENNMMMAPLFEHKPASTDFLLIRSKPRVSNAGSAAASTASSQSQSERVLIRKINRIFVAGQVEPQIEICQPIDSLNPKLRIVPWLEKYMAFHFAVRLRRREDMRFPHRTALELFSQVPEKFVERALEEVAERERQSDSKKTLRWVPKNYHKTVESTGPKRILLRRALEEKRKSLVTNSLQPEDVSAWEQVQLGLEKLRQTGIRHVARVDIKSLNAAYLMLRKLYILRKSSHKALMDMNKLSSLSSSSGFPEEATRELTAARYVLHEVQLTPWYLSHCFYWLQLHPSHAESPFSPNTLLRVSGLGDPSGRSEMVSFWPWGKYVQKLVNPGGAGKAGDLDEDLSKLNDDDEIFIDPIDNMKRVGKRITPAMENKQKYGGTGDDLRILSMESLGDILEALGVPSQHLKEITRWDRTWIIEKAASSDKGPYLLGGAIYKYARNNVRGVTTLDGIVQEVATDEHRTAAGVSTTSVSNMEDAMAVEMVARKKIENSAVFTKHRERLTAVYNRMMNALTTEKQNTASTTTSIVSATSLRVGSNDAAAGTGEADLHEFMKMLEGKAAGGENDDDDDDDDEPMGGSNKRLIAAALLEKKNVDLIRREVEQDPSIGAAAMAETRRLEAAASHQSAGWKPFRVLKRTIIEMDEQLKPTCRVEYIKSHDEISRFEQEKALKEEFSKKTAQQSVDKYFSTMQLLQGNVGGGVGGSTAVAAVVSPSSSARAPVKPASRSHHAGVGSGGGVRSAGGAPRTVDSEKLRVHDMNKTWYQEQIQKFGSAIFPSFTEEDARLPATFPRRQGVRCSACKLPGHTSADVACPAFNITATPKAAVPSVRGVGTGDVKNHLASLLNNDNLNKMAPGALQNLAFGLKSVFDVLVKDECSTVFRVPVGREVVGYAQQIKTPIDLSKIKLALGRGQYKNREMFMSDLDLMAQNSVTFNGAENYISVSARALRDSAYRILFKERGGEFESLENSLGGGQGSAKTAFGIKEGEAEIVVEEGEEEIFMEEANDGEAVEEGAEEVIVEEGEEEVIVEEGEGEVIPTGSDDRMQGVEGGDQPVVADGGGKGGEESRE